MASNELPLSKLAIDEKQFKKFVEEVQVADFPNLQKNDMPTLRWFTFFLIAGFFMAIGSLDISRMSQQSDVFWVGELLANMTTELFGITLVVVAFDSLRDAKLGIMQEKECERYVKLLYMMKDLEQKLTSIEASLPKSNSLNNQPDLNVSADLAMIKKELEYLTSQKHSHRKYLNKRVGQRHKLGSQNTNHTDK